MPWVRITEEAEQALRSRAEKPLASHHRRGTADGGLEILLSEEVYNDLQMVSFPSESLSDTIVRVCSTYGKRAQ